jgi:hypothetical protein
VADFKSEPVADLDWNGWPKSNRNGWPTSVGFRSQRSIVELLTAPVIYSVIVPLVLGDISASVYQAVVSGLMEFRKWIGRSILRSMPSISAILIG